MLRLSSLFRRSRFEASLDAELADHLQKYADDLVARGIPRPEAELRARREFGGVAQFKDEVRDSSGLGWVDAISRDLKYGLRVLWKSPGFSLTAILILALCIGANTAIFSVVDAALFRDVPYPQVEKLGQINLHAVAPTQDTDGTRLSGNIFQYLRDQAHSVELAVTAGTQGVNLALSPTQAVYVKQHRVSAGYFHVLGVAPALGREIDPAEDIPGGPPVAVLSQTLWRSAFSADPNIIGRGIQLRGEPYTVIGVMPANFVSMPAADVWTPLRPTNKGEGSGNNFSILARVLPGYQMSQANAELANLSKSYFTLQKVGPGVTVQLHLLPIQQARAAKIRNPLLLLWAAVGTVLLIGCVNIAGLLLARGGTRRHEIATRMALGSSRLGIARQLLTESLLIAISGGTLGLLLGQAIIVSIGPALASSIGFEALPQLDGRVTLATLSIACVKTLLFGLYPAWSLTRLDVRGSLASSSRTSSAHYGASRRLLVICEVALGVTLLAGAGLVVRSLSYLTHLEAGFDGDNVITANLSLQDARYAEGESIDRLFDASLAKLRAIPGVESAGIGLTLPYQGTLNDQTAVTDGPQASQKTFPTNLIYVTPGFFETLHIPTVAGRLFDNRDHRGGPTVLIINEAFALRYFKGDNPIGRHLRDGEIIGVVGDTQQRTNWNGTGPIDPTPTMYVAAAQSGPGLFKMVHTWFTPSWVVRTRGPQTGIAAAMQKAIAEVDPLLPFAEFRSMNSVRDSSLELQRAETWLFGSVAGLALLLSAIGIYGLIAQSVAERTREFGIRMALGASAMQAIGQAGRQGLILALAGCVIGCLFALGLGKYIRSLLVGVQPNDPYVLALVVFSLILVAAIASFLPTLRIARIDPAQTLREE